LIKKTKYLGWVGNDGVEPYSGDFITTSCGFEREKLRGLQKTIVVDLFSYLWK
jgi:hypothetical protein